MTRWKARDDRRRLRWERIRFVIIPHLAPLATFVALVQLMDNFRVFEPIVGFSAEANATSLSMAGLQRPCRSGRPAFRLGRGNLGAHHRRCADPPRPGAPPHLARVQPVRWCDMSDRPPAARRPERADPHRFLAIWMIAAAFPFAWTVWGSSRSRPTSSRAKAGGTRSEGTRTQAQTGSLHRRGYEGAWVKERVLAAAINTLIVTVSVTLISLTIGTLGGYALARSGSAMPSGS
jgi:hypothetical protein